MGAGSKSDGLDFPLCSQDCRSAGPVVFPPLIESRPWLRERLIALYKELDPLRGTIIHDRHFQATGGTLEVSSSKGGTIGPVVTFSPDDLRNFAVVLVSLLRYLEGTWTMDLFQEKRIRCALDELVHLHRLPSLGQLPPGFLTVRDMYRTRTLSKSTWRGLKLHRYLLLGARHPVRGSNYCRRKRRPECLSIFGWLGPATKHGPASSKDKGRFG